MGNLAESMAGWGRLSGSVLLPVPAITLFVACGSVRSSQKAHQGSQKQRGPVTYSETDRAGWSLQHAISPQWYLQGNLDPVRRQGEGGCDWEETQPSFLSILLITLLGKELSRGCWIEKENTLKIILGRGQKLCLSPPSNPDSLWLQKAECAHSDVWEGKEMTEPLAQQDQILISHWPRKPQGGQGSLWEALWINGTHMGRMVTQ